MKSLPVIFFIGPTGIGKSDLALSLAQDYNAEIVVMDSAQVYYGLDIGSAKPNVAEQKSVPHHVLDLVTPMQRYSVDFYLRDSYIAIESIRSRGKIPFIVGGTMLYYRSLLYGLDSLPHAPYVREFLNHRLKTCGLSVLYQELQNYDPVSAQRIYPQDALRVQRALEVYYLTGVPLSTHHSCSNKAIRLPWPFLTISLYQESRVELYQAVTNRYYQMLKKGLIAEVMHVMERYPQLTAQATAMKHVGYKQVFAYLSGHLNYNEMIEKSIQGTCHVVKRQLTWMRQLSTGVSIEKDNSCFVSQSRLALNSFLENCN